MKFDKETRARCERAAREWWLSLRPGEGKNGVKHPGNRAALAKLRRADGDPLEALAEPATIRLYKLLGLEPGDASTSRKAEALARVAVLASVLAHVREDMPKQKLGRALGPTDPKTPESAVMKPLRLARFLAARGEAEIATSFRRAVALLGDTANVGDLAWLVLTWDRDEAGDRTRTLFAFAYHDASAHAPDEIQPTETPFSTAAPVGETPAA